ncbi:hypothetical protein GWI33_021988 [Rhynchophorus ferrugineus]|uniref:Uncharacterized protein n=1 Tax=Rhynchophorus ferrugineus TaxID=354439 RepID=A0A834IT24_RHYFE|nr:hypothetical protein GWI33_021988 [Rhynchophorus ferrugineus]
MALKIKVVGHLREPKQTQPTRTTSAVIKSPYKYQQELSHQLREYLRRSQLAKLGDTINWGMLSQYFYF